MAKILEVNKCDKITIVKVEEVNQLLTGTKEYKIWNNSHPDFFKGLRVGNIINILASSNTKYGWMLENYEVEKEAKLGLTEQEQDDLFNRIIHYLDSSKYSKQASVIKLELLRSSDLFKTFPAAISKHHNYIGGLIQHTTEVIKYINLTGHPKVDIGLCVLTAIIHDIGKIKEYKIDPETGLTEYNKDFRESLRLNKDNKISAHILWVYNWCLMSNMPEIANIVASHHGITDWGSLFTPSSPEAELLFIADYYSSRFGKITVEDLD